MMKYRTKAEITATGPTPGSYFEAAQDYTSQLFEFVSGVNAFDVVALITALAMVTNAYKNALFRDKSEQEKKRIEKILAEMTALLQAVSVTTEMKIKAPD